MIIPTLNIIHLVERLDRKNHLLNQLIKYKIPYKIWHGMVSPIAVTGISRSHRQIVDFAKNTGMPTVTIGEDDIRFTSPKSWKYYLDNMPEEFDIYLGTVSGGEVDEEKKEVMGWSGLILYTVHERFYNAFLAAEDGQNIDRWLSGKGLETIERILGRKPVYKVCYPIVATCVSGVSDNTKKIEVYDKNFAAYKQFQ